jgi:hypothetical protein
MTDQAAEFDRTLAVTSKEGLSMNWDAQTFAQVTAELSLDDDDIDGVPGGSGGETGGPEESRALAAGDDIALGQDATVVAAAAMKEWPPPAEGSEGQLVDVNVAFGDESMVQSVQAAAAASDAEATRQLLAERRKRTAAMDAVWGVESVAPNELTPRRRGWSEDKRIYNNHKEMLEATKNPLRACVLEAGATLEAAPRAHAEDLRLPRHGTCGMHALTPATATTQTRAGRQPARLSATCPFARTPDLTQHAFEHPTTIYQPIGAHSNENAKCCTGTNRFRAVTPNSVTPNGARERPAAVLARGHHVKEGQPDYLDTQNSFAVPKDWYVATVDSTPPVSLPRKVGTCTCTTPLRSALPRAVAVGSYVAHERQQKNHRFWNTTNTSGYASATHCIVVHRWHSSPLSEPRRSRG